MTKVRVEAKFKLMPDAPTVNNPTAENSSQNPEPLGDLVVGQGVKNIPPPPDPFASPPTPQPEVPATQPSNSETTSSPPPPPENQPIKLTPPPPSEPESTLPQPPKSIPIPTPTPGISPKEPLKTELSPEITRTIEIARQIERSRNRKRKILLIIILFLLFGALLSVAYFLIFKNREAPPATNDRLDVSSLLTPTNPNQIPATKTATEEKKPKSERGFGKLLPLDFSSFIIKGLDLGLLVVNSEATTSAEITEKNGKTYVYSLSSQGREASSSAIFWVENKREILGLKNFGPLEFEANAKDLPKSLYPLRSVESALGDILSAENIYGGAEVKIDLSKNPLKNLTLTAVELAYFQSPPYLVPIYVIEADGTPKSGSQKIKLFFWGEALTP